MILADPITDISEGINGSEAAGMHCHRRGLTAKMHRAKEMDREHPQQAESLSANLPGGQHLAGDRLVARKSRAAHELAHFNTLHCSYSDTIFGINKFKHRS